MLCLLDVDSGVAEVVILVNEPAPRTMKPKSRRSQRETELPTKVEGHSVAPGGKGTPTGVKLTWFVDISLTGSLATVTNLLVRD
jgi:hypothetical protein